LLVSLPVHPLHHIGIYYFYDIDLQESSSSFLLFKI
jgi:hypothetical protein